MKTQKQKDARFEVGLSKKTITTKNDKFPLLVILIGVLFSLFLQWHIQDEIFFSGDGGLKALLAKQFSTGNFHFDLQLPVESWVRELWNQGLYPFEPPFAYKIFGLYYITFPFTFPIITAPFYAVFGFRGLYIVPLLATWSLWFGFYGVCRHFKLGSIITSIAIATLIFASPLTMYSSMYWEHTLAISLAFNGLAILLVRGASEKFLARDAVLSGVLIGLSIWFREELLCLAGIISLLVAASWKVNLEQLTLVAKRKAVFLLSLILTIALFFILNLIIYNHPLGIHSIQLVEKFSLVDRFFKAYGIFSKITEELFTYFPTIYICIIYVALALFYKQIKVPPVAKKLLLISTSFTIFIPAFLPSDGGKQWATRFLLILIPFICLIAGIALQSIWKIQKLSLRYLSLIVFTIFFGIGLHINTYLGTKYCYPQKDSPTLTTLNILRQDNSEILATPNQYVNQTFESLFESKDFFLTKKSEELIKLASELHKQGYEKFTYICPSYDACYSANKIPDSLEFVAEGKSLSIEFAELANINQKIGKVINKAGIERKLGKIERYKIYEGKIIDVSGNAQDYSQSLIKI